MALMSDAIPVAESTPFTCSFTNYKQSVNVLILFYTDAAGGVALAPQAGSRDVTAATTKQAFSGSAYRPSSFKRDVASTLDNGTLTLTGGVEDELLLGSGMGNVTLVAAPDVNPPGAASYRIFVDAAGQTATG